MQPAEGWTSQNQSKKEHTLRHLHAVCSKSKKTDTLSSFHSIFHASVCHGAGLRAESHCLRDALFAQWSCWGVCSEVGLLFQASRADAFRAFFFPQFFCLSRQLWSWSGRAATTSRLLQEFQYPYLFHLMDSYGPYGYLSAFGKASKA